MQSPWQRWIGRNVPPWKASPGKLGGAWVFKNTRMPVSAVFENLEAGATVGAAAVNAAAGQLCPGRYPLAAEGAVHALLTESARLLAKGQVACYLRRNSKRRLGASSGSRKRRPLRRVMPSWV